MENKKKPRFSLMDGLNKACGVFQVHTPKRRGRSPLPLRSFTFPRRVFTPFSFPMTLPGVSFYDIYFEGLQLSPVCAVIASIVVYPGRNSISASHPLSFINFQKTLVLNFASGHAHTHISPIRLQMCVKMALASKSINIFVHFFHQKTLPLLTASVAALSPTNYFQNQPQNTLTLLQIKVTTNFRVFRAFISVVAAENNNNNTRSLYC